MNTYEKEAEKLYKVWRKVYDAYLSIDHRDYATTDAAREAEFWASEDLIDYCEENDLCGSKYDPRFK